MSKKASPILRMTMLMKLSLLPMITVQVQLNKDKNRFDLT
jgi:hypothetical protein